RHAPGRTVTEADNVSFSTLTMNTQSLHLDAHWSAQQEFGQPLVNSMFTLSTIVGASVAQLTQGTIVANLGFEKVNFPSRSIMATRYIRKQKVWTSDCRRHVPDKASSPSVTSDATNMAISWPNASGPRCYGNLKTNT